MKCKCFMCQEQCVMTESTDIICCLCYEEIKSRLTAAEKRVKESKSLELDYIAQVKSKTAIGKVWLRRIKDLEGALEKAGKLLEEGLPQLECITGKQSAFITVVGEWLEALKG